jgi:hypothetical protein
MLLSFSPCCNGGRQNWILCNGGHFLLYRNFPSLAISFLWLDRAKQMLAGQEMFCALFSMPDQNRLFGRITKYAFKTTCILFDYEKMYCMYNI